jgi:hypothetical protein
MIDLLEPHDPEGAWRGAEASHGSGDIVHLKVDTPPGAIAARGATIERPFGSQEIIGEPSVARLSQ